MNILNLFAGGLCVFFIKDSECILSINTASLLRPEGLVFLEVLRNMGNDNFKELSS
jgi:hypothetical protein